MLPVVANALCCEVPRCFSIRMPRVVPDQRDKFDNDELFRKLSRETEVRYTGFRDRPHDERQVRFQTECREGRADLAFIGSGINLQLQFTPTSWSDISHDRSPPTDYVDFNQEAGKVHLKAQLILNGVCVYWKGWLDLHRLDGTGWLEFDENRAKEEDDLLRDQIEQYNRRIQDFEDRSRQYREDQERQAEAEAETRRQLAFAPSPASISSNSD